MAKGKKKLMTMKEFEGTAADKAADRKALKKVNEKRKSGGKNAGKGY